MFADLTAREILEKLAPRFIKPARGSQMYGGFVPAGTRHRRLSLVDKLARLERNPPRMVAPVAPRSFTEEEIAEGFRRSEIRLRGGLLDGIEYPPLSSAHVQNRQRMLRERFWGPGQHGHTPEKLLELEQARAQIAAQFPAPMTVSETVTAQPIQPQPAVDAAQEVELVSITGTPTSAFNTVIGGITDAITGIATPTGINAITNLIAATRGNTGAVPAALNPMGVSTPFVGGAVMPGGVMAPGAVPAGLGELLDLPLVDITPQGTSGLTSPFHTTASGNQVAQPFVKSKSNGKTEWFIPAGQPKTWTKASRKRAHSHRHHHPR
jgi:hypothetical protein